MLFYVDINKKTVYPGPRSEAAAPLPTRERAPNYDLHRTKSCVTEDSGISRPKVI